MNRKSFRSIATVFCITNSINYDEQKTVVVTFFVLVTKNNEKLCISIYRVFQEE
jgi:hypothetical protein